MNKFNILCVLLFAVACLAQTCQRDYQCGDVPYKQCEGGADNCWETHTGFAIDNNENINFVKYCNDINPVSEYLGTEVFKKVSVNGGEVTDVLEYHPATYSPVNEFVSMTSDGEFIYFAAGAQIIGSILQRPFNVLKTSTGQVTYIGGFETLDVSDSKTYVCQRYGGNVANPQYTIEVANGLLGVNSVATEILYDLNHKECRLIQTNDNSDDLYVLTFNLTTTAYDLYKGSKSCMNCTTPLSFLRSIDVILITDFDVYDGKMYISYSGGVRSIDLSSGAVFDYATGGYFNGIQVRDGKVYWSNTKTFFSANLDGSNVVNLSLLGHCSCRDTFAGFTGNDCRTCNGQVQWRLDVPECIAVDENGVPARCRADWHCPNLPYTQCISSRCQCLPGFTGFPACNTCANSTQSVQWNDHVPYCQ